MKDSCQKQQTVKIDLFILVIGALGARASLKLVRMTVFAQTTGDYESKYSMQLHSKEYVFTNCEFWMHTTLTIRDFTSGV